MILLCVQEIKLCFILFVRQIFYILLELILKRLLILISGLQ